MKIIRGSIAANKKLVKPVSFFEKEMFENGWLRTSRIDFASAQKYFAVEANGEIISFLIFDRHHYLKTGVSILGAWTKPEYRRHHLYNKLFKYLSDTYRAKGYDAIISGFHEGNVISRAMQENQGREIKELKDNGFHTTIFYLKKGIRLEH